MTEQAMGEVCPPSRLKYLNSSIRKLFHNPGRIMGKLVQPGDTVVDLGCGGGFFSVALARMVGEHGRVIAVDLQQEMLEITRQLAARKGVLEQIELHRCQAEDLGLAGITANFVLSFYVVHEVPNRPRFLAQVAELLAPGARYLLVEPWGHVSPAQFRQILDEADGAGLQQVTPLKVFRSRAALLACRQA
jgi:ubiquinone/menaquinone biosynthesis C-methylase UbiE